MVIAISGSRSINNKDLLKSVINNSNFPISELVFGDAKGVDAMAKEFAVENKIPYKVFIPDWKKYGRKAGILRNIDMINHSDALIALWDGKSRGTKHAIDYAKKLSLLVSVKCI